MSFHTPMLISHQLGRPQGHKLPGTCSCLQVWAKPRAGLQPRDSETGFRGRGAQTLGEESKETVMECRDIWAEPPQCLLCPYFPQFILLVLLIHQILLSLCILVGFPGSSAGKESACNSGDPGSLPGLGRSPGEGIGYPFQYYPVLLGFPGGSGGKESTCNAGDLYLGSGLGRFSGGGHGNPLQYSFLKDTHGQRSLEAYSPQGDKELDMIE